MQIIITVVFITLKKKVMYEKKDMYEKDMYEKELN